MDLICHDVGAELWSLDLKLSNCCSSVFTCNNSFDGVVHCTAYSKCRTEHNLTYYVHQKLCLQTHFLCCISLMEAHALIIYINSSENYYQKFVN